MSEWPEYKLKWIKKLLEIDGNYIVITVFNNTYMGCEYTLLELLYDVIHEEFPEVKKDNIHVGRRDTGSNELTLSFSLLKDDYDVKNLLAAGYEWAKFYTRSH